MTVDLTRRDALKLSASFALGVAGGFSCVELASAAPIEIPAIDKLSVRVLVDSASDIFFRPQEVAGVKTEPGRSSDAKRPLHSEWGLSLYLEPQRGEEKRTFLLDFGWTPEAINNNMDLMKIDPSKVDALIMSHGHFDHLGGLLGFLDRHRKDMPAELTIYAGGEDNFCQRYVKMGAMGDLADFGMLDRRDIAKRNVKLVLCEAPVVIGGQAFTTGKINATASRRYCRTRSSNSSRRTAPGAMRAITCRPRWKARSSRRAHPRTRDLLQPEGQGPCRHFLLRPCRYRELGPAGDGGFGRAKGSRHHGRLPSWACTG